MQGPRSLSIVLQGKGMWQEVCIMGMWYKFLTAHSHCHYYSHTAVTCPKRTEICFLSRYWMSGVSATAKQQHLLEGKESVMVCTYLNQSPSDWCYWLRVQLQERSWCSNSCLVSQEISPRSPILLWMLVPKLLWTAGCVATILSTWK